MSALLLFRFVWITRPGGTRERSSPALVFVWLSCVGIALVYPVALTQTSRAFDPLLLAPLPVALLALLFHRRIPTGRLSRDGGPIRFPGLGGTPRRVSRLLARAEQRLSAAQGGLFQLLLLLLLIAILSGFRLG